MKLLKLLIVWIYNAIRLASVQNAHFVVIKEMEEAEKWKTMRNLWPTKCNKYENKNGFTFKPWSGEEGHWNADYTITRNSTLKDYVIEFSSQSKQNLILCALMLSTFTPKTLIQKIENFVYIPWTEGIWVTWNFIIKILIFFPTAS